MKNEDVQGLRPSDLRGPIPKAWYPAHPAMRISEDVPPAPLDCFAHGPVEAADGKLVFVIPSCVDGWMLCVRATQFDAVNLSCSCGDPTCSMVTCRETIGVIAARHEIGGRRGRELQVSYDWALYWPNSYSVDEDGLPSHYQNDAFGPVTRAFGAWASTRFEGVLPPPQTLEGCTEFYVGDEEVYLGEDSTDGMSEAKLELAVWMMERRTAALGATLGA
jgi:hypothetical protein